MTGVGPPASSFSTLTGAPSECLLQTLAGARTVCSMYVQLAQHSHMCWSGGAA